MAIVKELDCIKYVDREDEVSEILDDINKCTSEKALIIYSETAIGKTTVTRKVKTELEKDYSNKTVVIAETSPNNEKINSSEWEYLYAIFNELQNCFINSSKYNFSNFYANSKNKYVYRKGLNNLLDKTCESETKNKLLINLLSYIIKRKFKLGIFDENNALEFDDKFSRSLKQQYIRFILSCGEIVLVLRDAQKIDFESLNFLITCISENIKISNYFIFEYTISNNYPSSKMFDFVNKLGDAGIPVVNFQLKKLSKNYALDIIYNHFESVSEDIDFSINVVNYYDSEANGNIKRLLDYVISYEKIQDSNESVNSTFINIKSLSNYALYFLSLLVYSNGNMDNETLNYFVAYSKISDNILPVVLRELCEHDIITENQSAVSISHSYVVSTWEEYNEEFCVYNKFVFKNLEQQLIKDIQCELNVSEVLRRKLFSVLLHMYSEQAPQKLCSLFSEMEHNVFTVISPNDIWKYVNIFVENTKHTIEKFINLYIKIVRLCFKLELYNEGYSCIKLLEDSDYFSQRKDLIFYKQQYLSELDRHFENIELYKKYKKIFYKESREYLTLSLGVLSSFRSTSNIEACLEIFNEIKKSSTYKLYIEYGYFLRLTDIFLPNQVSINYVKKSIKYFKLNKNFPQMYKSMLTYSRLIALKGKFNKSIKYLLKIAEGLKDLPAYSHMVLINTASTLLLKGENGNSIWDILNEAEVTASVPFDRLAIVVDKIAWVIENKEFDRLALLENKAINLIAKEPDKHIHGLVYYNLYYGYRCKGDEAKAVKYYNLAKDMSEYCRFVKYRLDNIKTQETKIMLKHPWHICYLADWSFDILF